MDVDRLVRTPLSRRRLLGGLTATAAAGVLGGCGGSGAGDRSEPRPSSDVQSLNAVLDLEHMSVAAYTAGATALRGRHARMGRRLRDQEREHVEALSGLITDLGGRPSVRRPAYDFPALGRERDVLRFSAQLEQTAIAAYIDLLPRLTDPALRGTAASILGAEAQHVAVLRDALGLEPALHAFVTGRPA